jgi:hypothetical protein
MSAALLATNSELGSPRPEHLLAPDYFSALIPLALLFALGRRFPRQRPLVAEPAPDGASGLRFWHAATLLLLLLTFVFSRNKVLLAPLLALYPGLLWRGLGDPQGGRERGGKERARRRHSWRHRLVAAGLAAALVWTAIDAVRLVRVLPVHLEPDDRRAIGWLRAAGRPGDVLLGDWGRGYAVEWHAGLASATDGLLEVAGMPERIAAFGRALYATDPAPLAALCREVGARYLWVPGDKRRVHAAYAGLDADDYFRGGFATERGRATCFARLLAMEPLPGIRPRFQAGAQVLCEVIADSLPPAPEP